MLTPPPLDNNISCNHPFNTQTQIPIFIYPAYSADDMSIFKHKKRMLKKGLTVLRLDAQLKQAHRERLYVYEIQFQIRLWLYNEDVKKCESILTTLNDPLNAADNLLSSIETKRKALYKEDHTLKSYASDELSYLTTAN